MVWLTTYSESKEVMGTNALTVALPRLSKTRLLKHRKVALKSKPKVEYYVAIIYYYIHYSETSIHCLKCITYNGST